MSADHTAENDAHRVACTWPRCSSPRIGKCVAWCKCRCHSARRATSPAAREVWDGSVAPGGYVCSVCGVPSESEPCHHLAHVIPPAATERDNS